MFANICYTVTLSVDYNVILVKCGTTDCDICVAFFICLDFRFIQTK